MSHNTVVLFSKILLTEKKHIARLKRQEYIELKESGQFDIQWCYDGKHSVVRKKGSIQRAVTSPTEVK